MINKLYGTDGIRGLYKEKITPYLAMEIGRSASIIFERENEINTIIVGQDSRPNSCTLKHALISGITSMGTNVIDVGIIPTALVPFLIQQEKANAGIMITASSSPKEYAGLKLFNGNSYVISKEQETHFEYMVSHPKKYSILDFNSVGVCFNNEELTEKYIEHQKLQISFKGYKILVSCSNGSISKIAQKVLSNTKNQVVFINCNQSDNLIAQTSFQDLKLISQMVVDEKFDFGFVYSPDGHKVQVIDKNGNLLSGELLTFFFAKKLNQNKIVTEIDSNIGLSESLNNIGKQCYICENGEGNVIETMLKNNITFAGGKNGTFYFLEQAKTSDCLQTTINFLNCLNKDDNIFSFCDLYKPYYQINLSFNLTEKKKEKILDIVNISENMFRYKGRVIFRKSGNENIYRIVIEGEDVNLCDEVKKEILNEISNNSY